MDEWQKQRYRAKGECIADIVQLIDRRADEEGLVEFNEVWRHLGNKIKEYSDRLSNDDVGDIKNYIEHYLGIVINHKNIPVNGYIISRKGRSHTNQFQGSAGHNHYKKP